MICFGLLLALPGAALAQQSQCPKMTLELCPNHFADRCRSEKAFQDDNTAICLDIILGRAKDDPVCAQYDAVACATLESARGEERDCSAIKDPFERAACEDQFPECAESANALVTESGTLITQVKAELDRYSDLLNLNLDSVADKDRLCAFTRETLTKYYNDATADSSAIRLLETNAGGIQACAAEIELWVEKTSLATTDDKLQDSLIRETREQLKPLKGLRTELNDSVRRLGEAEPKIFSLIKFHNRFCSGQAGASPVEKP